MRIKGGEGMYENSEERWCKWSVDKARRDKIRSSDKMKRLDKIVG